MGQETGITSVAGQTRATTITFGDDPEERWDRSRSCAAEQDSARRRRSSASRDSISSVRARVNSTNYGIPITYRTLSFQASEQRTPLGSQKGGLKAGPDAAAADSLPHKVDEHLISVEKLLERLGVSGTLGLTSDAAAKQLQEDGYNVLPRPRKNYLKTLARYVFGGFCSILWVGVIVFFICWRPLGDPDPQPYNLGLAILVIIVILLQASFSAFQDWSTAKTMNSILDMLPSEATVLRDGVISKIVTKELVMGDIVRLETGNKVPADLRLIGTSGDTRFDRSAMTGESEEVEASVDCTDDNIFESRNMALMGTVVANGNATGVVVFTGAKTVMGAIAKATSSVKEKPTAIQREITRFVRIICALTVCLVLLILCAWLGWLRIDHRSFMSVVGVLNNIMGCVVAFIPEGMPVGVALTLMLIAKRMKAVNVLPKSLATVETLGCVSVICSDKTGTLTKNQMTLTSVGFADGAMSAGQAKQLLAQERPSMVLRRLVRACRLCNGGELVPPSVEKPTGDHPTQGNATDGALLRFTEEAAPGSPWSHEFPPLSVVPFHSKNKFMMTIHKSSADSSDAPQQPSTAYTVFVKGGPDVLLPKCSRYWSQGTDSVTVLDAAARTRFGQLQDRMSRNAERVIMLCEREYSPSSAFGSNELSQELLDHGTSDLTVIGMVGILDPPRPETAATVQACRRAGVRVYMMTGDFGLTGAAIARQVGIFSDDREPDTMSTIESRRRPAPNGVSAHSDQSLLLEGSQISELEKDDWDMVCKYEEIVFGRCTPEHKLRIVNELREHGFTTAVTGDGVNDAPALKAADVGVAMVNGSDVAIEAAHLVLLDRFDSIVDGIRLGRLVFQNLQKVISYLLPAGSWSEIWPVLLNVFCGVPLPLSSFLMIIICVFTDLSLALSLIMEKEEFDLLSLPPRDRKKEHLINLRIYAQSYLFIGVMETICAHSMFFLYYWRYARIPVGDLFFAFEKYTDGFHGYAQAELTAFNTTGQSVYFVTLVILQWGNILSIRNKKLSILQADPIRKQRRNPWLLLSASLSLAVAIFVTMEPGIQSLFGTGSAPVEFWFLPLPLALGILVMDELRKLCVRTWPRGPLAAIAW